MATSTRYGKPCMTNLPSELGVAIFQRILSTPRPDREKRRIETMEIEKEMLEMRLKEDDPRNSAK